MRLEISNVTAGYSGKKILDSFSMKVEAGMTAALAGPNGCGKSTLIKVAAGVLKPFSGEVTLDGRNLQSIPKNELARIMAYMPQEYSAPGDVTVAEFVSYGRFPFRRFGFGLSRKDIAIVADVIHSMKLDSLGERRLADLSGGERQRVRAAMALAQEPSVLLLDEPTAFLDVGSRLEFAELIRKIARERKIAALTALHDLNLAARCSDIVTLMKHGRARFSGAPENVLLPDAIREIFKIESEIHHCSDGRIFCAPLRPARTDGETEKNK